MVYEKKGKLIAAKGLTKNLINGYSIFNNEKYFYREDGSQNYFVFYPIRKYFKRLTNDTIRRWNQSVCQMEVSNLLLHQKIVFIQDEILGHNIFDLYNVLTQVRFAASKTKLVLWYNKPGIRVAERLKT